LLQNFLENKSKSIIKKSLESLVDYGYTHFNSEEFYIYLLNEKEELLNHIIGHNIFVTKLIACQNDYDADGMTFEILKYIHEWLNHHVIQEDVNIFKKIKIEYNKLNNYNKFLLYLKTF
jgi:hemerythrin-like metal-binding protein